MKNINYEMKNYLGILVENNHNFKEDNSIGIYCENKLIQTFIIDKVSQNSLLIENKKVEYDSKKKYSILNMNLQNNILYEFTE